MKSGRSRRWRLTVGIGAVVVLLVILNVIGLARYPGGPLRDRSADAPLWLDMRPSDQGSSSVGNDRPTDWAQAGVPLYYGLLTLHNPWPWSATVEAITPIDPTDGLQLDAVYVSRPGSIDGSAVTLALASSLPLPPGHTLDQDYVRLPATVEPSGDGHDRDAEVLVEVHADRPGVLGFSALAVDYRVGPFTFHTVQHLAMDACLGPLPSGATC